MADTFVEVKRTGYFSRIGQSLAGMLAGFVLFFASFGVLYWNEGRADLSTIAKTAAVVSAETANQDQALEGKLVSTTGKLVAGPALGDTFLKEGNYLAIKRTVEMYAWVEEKKVEKHSEAGGTEVEKTTYNYKKVWTENPPASDNFNYPGDHYNPAKPMDSTVQRAETAKVGIYAIDPQNIDLPNFVDLVLGNQNLNASLMQQQKGRLWSNKIFLGKGSPDFPTVGDLRISYAVVKSGISATVFGQLSGIQLVAYVDNNKNRLYRAFEGTREEAIKTLHDEYVASLWIWRLVGFAMMWFGLYTIFGPLTVIVDILPFLGSLGRAVVGIVTFVVALVLTVITVVISMLVHNIVALIIVLVIAVAVLWYLRYGLVKKKPGANKPA
jgi:hypothetical protein